MYKRNTKQTLVIIPENNSVSGHVKNRLHLFTNQITNSCMLNLEDRLIITKSLNSSILLLYLSNSVCKRRVSRFACYPLFSADNCIFSYRKYLSNP